MIHDFLEGKFINLNLKINLFLKFNFKRLTLTYLQQTTTSLLVLHLTYKTVLLLSNKTDAHHESNRKGIL